HQRIPRHIEHRGREIGARGRDQRRIEHRQQIHQHRHRHQHPPLHRPRQPVPPHPHPHPHTRPHRACLRPRSGVCLRTCLGVCLWPCVGGVVVGVCSGGHTRAFPSDSPRMPVGRNISTTTSTTNATMSFHS